MSLKRVLEPEVMDSSEEAEDYNAMDHSHVNQVFVQDLLAFVEAHGKPLGDVLDLGTGTALIPIELCQRDANCRVMAIDMAIMGSKTAEACTGCLPGSCAAARGPRSTRERSRDDRGGGPTAA